MEYVCDFIFGHILDCEWTLVFNPTYTEEIHITADDAAGSLSLVNSGLLTEAHIDVKWKALQKEMLLALKKSPRATWLNYDLLALVFFHISRYEEYIDVERDEHGRYLALKSCLHETGFIETPIVDQVVRRIQDELTNQFNLKFQEKLPRLISTIDVDFPWYRKHLKFPYYLRKNKHSGEEDIYDTFNEIIEVHKESNHIPIFFFLMGGSPPFDKIKRYKTTPYRELIQRIKSQTKIGIHPSYHSANDRATMSKSFDQFRSLTNERPLRSRQHYLLLTLPLTYRLLLQAGIEEDYTMGYAERVGFRAGTAHSFYWYDLEKEEKTSLLIIPLIAMDVTLKNYLAMTPDALRNKLMELKETIRIHGGNFSILWHNSNLSNIDGWAPYKKIYFEFIKNFNGQCVV